MLPMVELLCCPSCKGGLRWTAESATCFECQRSYPVLLGIPDFRMFSPEECGYGTVGEELQEATLLQDFASEHSLDETLRYWVGRFAQGQMADFFLEFRRGDAAKASFIKDRCSAEGVGNIGNVGLDLGCGSGGAMLGLAEICPSVIGMDLQLTELICARKQMQERGLADRCLFVAASAEHLPLRSDTLSHICSLDVYEHVRSRELFVTEAYRCLAEQGAFFFETPSRFQWIESHYLLPGLGYLPRPLQELYVRFARKTDYPIHLTSLWGLRKLLRRVLPAETYTVRAQPFISEQPKKVGARGRLLRKLPFWPLLVKLINSVMGHFTTFEVVVRKRA